MLKNKYIWLVIFIVIVLLLVGVFYARTDRTTELRDDLSYWQEGPLPEWDIELTDEQASQIEGKVTEVKSIIDDADNYDPEEVFFAYLKLGIYMESLNKPVASRDAYLEATRWGEESSIPWLNLSGFYGQAGDLERAEAALNKALEMDPNSELVWDKVLDFYQYQFHSALPAMLEIYNQAFEYVGESIFLRKRYARYLESENAIGPALEQWEKVVELDPADQSAVKEVERLKSITDF